jgi:uncharacterized YigZ family protein
MQNKTQLLVPALEIRREMMVANSRFISSLAPASSVEVARAFIAHIYKEFPDASHHVPAFIIGHGASKLAHCSDAGEPAGSAGRPALAVLQGSELGDVVVVVTRYFGGTKLGVGGLVRAYGDAVRSVIKDVPLAEKIRAHTLILTYAYPLVERMRLLISANMGQVLEENFGAEVTMKARLSVDDLPVFEQGLAELSNGNSHITIVETGEILMPIG